MVEKYSLSHLGHARSSQIKEFHKVSEEDGIGIYSIFTEWPGSPNMDGYLRIGFDPETKSIDFIDFDGGPWVSFGFKLDDGCIVDHFEHNGNFGDIKVVIKDPNFK